VADAIIADIARMKSTKQWLDGFEPSPQTYLNQQRWLDNEDQQVAVPPAAQLSAAEQLAHMQDFANRKWRTS
jgi:hypothetical protein